MNCRVKRGFYNAMRVTFEQVENNFYILMEQPSKGLERANSMHCLLWSLGVGIGKHSPPPLQSQPTNTSVSLQIEIETLC